MYVCVSSLFGSLDFEKRVYCESAEHEMANESITF